MGAGWPGLEPSTHKPPLKGGVGKIPVQRKREGNTPLYLIVKEDIELVN
jgi:hypothetical protein